MGLRDFLLQLDKNVGGYLPGGITPQEAKAEREAKKKKELEEENIRLALKDIQEEKDRKRKKRERERKQEEKVERVQESQFQQQTAEPVISSTGNGEFFSKYYDAYVPESAKEVVKKVKEIQRSPTRALSDFFSTVSEKVSQKGQQQREFNIAKLDSDASFTKQVVSRAVPDIAYGTVAGLSEIASFAFEPDVKEKKRKGKQVIDPFKRAFGFTDEGFSVKEIAPVKLFTGIKEKDIEKTAIALGETALFVPIVKGAGRGVKRGYDIAYDTSRIKGFEKSLEIQEIPTSYGKELKAKFQYRTPLGKKKTESLEVSLIKKDAGKGIKFDTEGIYLEEFVDVKTIRKTDTKTQKGIEKFEQQFVGTKKAGTPIIRLEEIYQFSGRGRPKFIKPGKKETLGKTLASIDYTIIDPLAPTVSGKGIKVKELSRKGTAVEGDLLGLISYADKPKVTIDLNQAFGVGLTVPGLGKASVPASFSLPKPSIPKPSKIKSTQPFAVTITKPKTKVKPKKSFSDILLEELSLKEIKTFEPTRRKFKKIREPFAISKTRTRIEKQFGLDEDIKVKDIATDIFGTPTKTKVKTRDDTKTKTFLDTTFSDIVGTPTTAPTRDVLGFRRPARISRRKTIDTRKKRKPTTRKKSRIEKDLTGFRLPSLTALEKGLYRKRPSKKQRKFTGFETREIIR